mmetsp:Transcript_26910/g.58713  ORF Transcript_26910/g.58713 Transcript_26910/m.58713 type:complete len:683 (-) Transcript_26910:136-2184(-)
MGRSHHPHGQHGARDAGRTGAGLLRRSRGPDRCLPPDHPDRPRTDPARRSARRAAPAGPAGPGPLVHERGGRERHGEPGEHHGGHPHHVRAEGVQRRGDSGAGGRRAYLRQDARRLRGRRRGPPQHQPRQPLEGKVRHGHPGGRLRLRVRGPLDHPPHPLGQRVLPEPDQLRVGRGGGPGRVDPVGRGQQREQRHRPARDQAVRGPAPEHQRHTAHHDAHHRHCLHQRPELQAAGGEVRARHARLQRDVLQRVVQAHHAGPGVQPLLRHRGPPPGAGVPAPAAAAAAGPSGEGGRAEGDRRPVQGGGAAGGGGGVEAAAGDVRVQLRADVARDGPQRRVQRRAHPLQPGQELAGERGRGGRGHRHPAAGEGPVRGQPHLGGPDCAGGDVRAGDGERRQQRRPRHPLLPRAVGRHGRAGLGVPGAAGVRGLLGRHHRAEGLLAAVGAHLPRAGGAGGAHAVPRPAARHGLRGVLGERHVRQQRDALERVLPRAHDGGVGGVRAQRRLRHAAAVQGEGEADLHEEERPAAPGGRHRGGAGQHHQRLGVAPLHRRGLRLRQLALPRDVRARLEEAHERRPPQRAHLQRVRRRRLSSRSGAHPKGSGPSKLSRVAGGTEAFHTAAFRRHTHVHMMPSAWREVCRRALPVEGIRRSSVVSGVARARQPRRWRARVFLKDSRWDGGQC